MTRDTRLLVRVEEVVLTCRAVDREVAVVRACAEHLDICAIVRAIICAHRHEHTLDALARLTLRELVVHRQVRDPLADTEATLIALGCMDIRLDVDICLVCRKAHAGRLHRHRLEVDERHLEVVRRILDLIADRELLERSFADVRVDRERGERDRADSEGLLEHAEIGFLHGISSFER